MWWTKQIGKVLKVFYHACRLKHRPQEYIQQPNHYSSCIGDTLVNIYKDTTLQVKEDMLIKQLWAIKWNSSAVSQCVLLCQDLPWKSLILFWVRNGSITTRYFPRKPFGVQRVIMCLKACVTGHGTRIGYTGAVQAYLHAVYFIMLCIPVIFA